MAPSSRRCRWRPKNPGNAEGEWQSRTEWHRVVCFSRLAEYARTLAKGTHLLVQGSVRSREYERDGAKLRSYELRAETIAKLDRVERRQAAEADAGEPGEA